MQKSEAKKFKGYVRFATSRLSFAKSPELAPCRSSNSVAFRAFTPYHFLQALLLRPLVPYEVAGAFQGSARYSYSNPMEGVCSFSLSSLCLCVYFFVM